MRRATIAAVTLAFCTAGTSPARADVQVGVHIGVPSPPVFAFDAPPRLIVVPGVPHVHYAPDVSVNFFSYGGRYYTYDDGSWFVARSGHGPWGYVERHYVPAPILRVPNRYYHVPPRLVGGGHWYGDGGHRYGKAQYHHGRGKHWKGNRHGGGKHHRGSKHRGHRH